MTTQSPHEPVAHAGGIRGRWAEARLTLDLFRAQHEGAAGIQRRQQGRLHTLMAHARERSPYYRQLYRGLPADPRLDLLPPVTKPELMADFDRWVTDPRITRAGVEAFVADPDRIGQAFLGRYFVCTTSGTTGDPGLFVHDEQAVAVYRALALRLDAEWLSPAQWLAIVRRGVRWAAVVGSGAHFAGVDWMESERRRSRWRRSACRVFPVQQRLDSLTGALDAFDPAILTGYPSALLQLAREQEHGRLHVHPVLVEPSGESMLPTERAAVARAFRREVGEAYASSEFQVMAIECRQGWLHVMADWVVLEPVDADLRPTRPGETSDTVLLTNLANSVQPIIRYDLGDRILARPDPCLCGNPRPAIRVAGRHDDVLHLSGTGGGIVEVLPLAIGSVVEGVPGLHRFQLVQSGPRTLRVRLEPTAGLTLDRIWPGVADALTRYLTGVGAQAELALAAEPPEPSARSGKSGRSSASLRGSNGLGAGGASARSNCVRARSDDIRLVDSVAIHLLTSAISVSATTSSPVPRCRRSRPCVSTARRQQ